MSARPKNHALVFAGALALAACGGGEEGTGINAQSPNPDVVVGTITAFGSIWVNGIEFDIDTSTIVVDGVVSTPADLRLGMVVTLECKIHPDNVTGTAHSVSVEEALRGPVSAVTANSITVLGQTVYLDSTTFFENFTDVNQLVGTDVEISGFMQASGTVSATRIERLAESTAQTKVQGSITDLNNEAKTFGIGSLIVNFANVTNMPTLANGTLVDIEGIMNTTTGQLDAKEVEIKTLPIADAAKFEYQGSVTLAFDNKTGEFTVDNLRVRTTTSTTYKGLKANELLVGIRVEVEGTLVKGIVQAKNVELKSPTVTPLLDD